MANYPTSASSDSNLYVAKNNLATTLNGSLTASGDNTGGNGLRVLSTTNFPTAGFVTIDSEAISYTGVSTYLGDPVFTGTTRGADGTTAATHVDVSTVYHMVIAAHHNALKDEIKAIENDLVNGMSIALNMNSHKITNLTDGSNSGDAVNFGQLSGKRVLSVAIATNTVQNSASLNTSTITEWANPAVTVTPVSSSSTFIVIASGTGYTTTGYEYIGITRGGNWLNGGYYQHSTQTSTSDQMIPLCVYDSPATSSSITYKIGAKSSAGTPTGYLNYGTRLIVIEVG